MSKTFETNAGKALTMVEGLRAHLDEVSHLGINSADLDTLEAEANKAIELIRQVDAMRAEVAERLASANQKLAEVKEQAMVYRQKIKANYPPEHWLRYGIQDKR